MERQRGRILDTFYLVCAAILVCALGIGAFALADIYHISSLWPLFGLISAAFVAMTREEYRKEFRSPRFVAFVIGWLVINVIVIIVIVAEFGSLWLIPGLIGEQALFYITAFWLFGIPLPARRGWPFQRPQPSDSNRD